MTEIEYDYIVWLLLKMKQSLSKCTGDVPCCEYFVFGQYFFNTCYAYTLCRS